MRPVPSEERFPQAVLSSLSTTPRVSRPEAIRWLVTNTKAIELGFTSGVRATSSMCNADEWGICVGCACHRVDY